MNSPHLTQTRLSNGLTLLHLHTPGDPISAGHIFFPGGAIEDPADKKGLSTLLWSLFLKGTKNNSAKKIAENLESVGASMGAGCQHDYASLSFYSLAEYFEEVLKIGVECLFEPAFQQDEFQKEKQALLAAIQSKEESIFTTTHEAVNKALYRNHPYAVPSSGIKEGVSRLKIDALRKWHKKVVVPNHAILSIASQIPFDKILPKMDKIFGPNQWDMSDISWKGLIRPPRVADGPQAIDKKSKFEQAFLIKAFPAASLISQDYIPLKVLNSLLGGGMSARLFQSLREKQGLAYDVGSFFPTKRSGSGFYIYMGLQVSRLKEATDRIENELKMLQNEKVPEEELTQVKNYLKGVFILDHQTNSQRAHYYAWWKTFGLSPEFDHQYREQVDAVTTDQIQQLAQKYFSYPSVTVQTLPESTPPPTPALETSGSVGEHSEG